MSLQDLAISLDYITVLEDSSVFQLNEISSRPFERDGADFVAGFDIQNDLNLTVLSRDMYTILDVLSDTGGIASALISLLVPIIGLLNYNHLESYIASRLFKISEKNPNMKKSTSFTASKYGNLAEYTLDAIPTCLVCCKKPKRYRAIQKARAALVKEIDVLELVKSIRFFKKGFEHLLSSDELRRLEETSEY